MRNEERKEITYEINNKEINILVMLRRNSQRLRKTERVGKKICCSV